MRSGSLSVGQGVLYHFSEDASIRRFEPRMAPSNPKQQEVVWAVDADHAYLYYFPRECPRVTFYASDRTTAGDRERFFGLTATHIAAIEAKWLEAMQSTRLFRYEFDADGFELIDAVAGYWVNREVVEPLSVGPVGDLIAALTDSGVELRVMPSLWPLQEAVVASSVEFSVIRWRNAAPRPREVPI